MDVYVIEVTRRDPNNHDTDIILHSTQDGALQQACVLAIMYMQMRGADVPGGVHFNDYTNILNQMNSGYWGISLARYNDWDYNCVPQNHRKHIEVYFRDVNMNSVATGAVFTIPSSCGVAPPSIPSGIPQTIPSGVDPANQKLPDVPCKQCGRASNISEKTC